MMERKQSLLTEHKLKLPIHYKLFEEEILGDAPFIGARLSSIDCHCNCPGCQNQHLKEYATLTMSVEELLAKVLDNPLHQGLILGGLEWTEQLEELRTIVEIFLNQDLQICVYTHLHLEKVVRLFPEWLGRAGLYLKCGEYVEGLSVPTISQGVLLATSNQCMYNMEQVWAAPAIIV